MHLDRLGMIHGLVLPCHWQKNFFPVVRKSENSFQNLEICLSLENVFLVGQRAPCASSVPWDTRLRLVAVLLTTLSIRKRRYVIRCYMASLLMRWGILLR